MLSLKKNVYIYTDLYDICLNGCNGSLHVNPPIFKCQDATFSNERRAETWKSIFDRCSRGVRSAV